MSELRFIVDTADGCGVELRESVNPDGVDPRGSFTAKAVLPKPPLMELAFANERYSTLLAQQNEKMCQTFNRQITRWIDRGDIPACAIRKKSAPSQVNPPSGGGGGLALAMHG